jgi:CheY-like chemotaxis protein
MSYKIAREDIDEALERARIGEAAFTRECSLPNRLPGWCVRLTYAEVPGFAAELTIAVAQRKAIAAFENRQPDQPLRMLMPDMDALDATVEVRKMLDRAEVAPDEQNPLLLMVFFPGYTVVDKVEEATV